MIAVMDTSKIMTQCRTSSLDSTGWGVAGGDIDIDIEGRPSVAPRPARRRPGGRPYATGRVDVAPLDPLGASVRPVPCSRSLSMRIAVRFRGQVKYGPS
jgi:hypothetical protein